MALTSFKSKVITSMMLSVAQFTARFGLQLVSIVVLARLLSPEIYGVFAVVLFFTYLLEMLSDMGIRSLILTREGDVEPEMLQTCWTLQIVRSLIIFGVVICIALGIAGLQALEVFRADSAYNAEVLPWALTAVGASQIILAFTPTTPYMYEREMKFGHVTLSIVISSTLALIVTIGFAMIYKSVWALVLGTVVQKCITVLYGYIAFRGVPMKLCWDRETLRLAVERGKWLWSHSVLSAFTNSADRLLVGMAFDSSTFGFYFIAARIVGFCKSFLGMVDGRMGLQVFRHILKADVLTFQNNYYRYRLFFDALAGIGAGSLLMLAPLIVDIVFDDRYAGVAPIMQFLALGLLLAGPMVLRSAFGADRQFKAMAVFGLTSAVTIWVGLILAIFVFDSFEGVLLVVALYHLPEVLMLFQQSAKRGWIKPIRETLPLVFFAVGIGLGWVALSLVEPLL